MNYPDIILEYHEASLSNDLESMTRIEEELEVLLNKPYNKNLYTFENGFLGLATLSIFVYSRKSIANELDVMLTDVDAMVVKMIDLRPDIDYSIKTGILGIVIYIFCRLSKSPQSNSDSILDLKERFVYLLDWIDDNSMHFNKSDLFYCLLLCLFLNIYNHKVYELLSRF